VTVRETEIQAQLETLYAQLEAFEEPFPDDAPFDYEVEELDAWEKLREQIGALEHELSEINIKKDASFGKTVAYYINLTDKILKNNRLARKRAGRWQLRA
jgi:hypothetical protein